MSLVTVIAASSQPAGGAPAEPSAIVSGAGTAAANGTYTQRGTSGGKPYYNLIGEPDNPANSAIVWGHEGGLRWHITDAGGANYYYDENEAAVAFPWLTTYIASAGDSPPPTVIEG